MFTAPTGPTPMHVLQVIPALESGGAERTTIEVAEALAAAGGQCTVASEGGRLERELKALGVRVVRMPLATKNPITVRLNAGRLRRLIQRREIDLVHARSRACGWSAYWAAKAAGKPFVTTYHGTYNAKTALKRWYNSVMARGDRIIANSEFIKAHVIEEHGVDPEQITVIPRGVDLKRFDPASVSRERIEAARARWGVTAAHRVVVLPARITPWKGHALALEAIARMERRPVLVFAGPAKSGSSFLRELRDAARRDGVDLRVPGHEDDMPAAMAAADVVINPSLEPEAFGRTAAEGLAMGRPVIVADHGGAREVVAAGETGWRTPPGDAAALSAAIEEALGLDFAQKARLGEAARARAARCFSKAALQESTLRVYREALDWMS